MLFCSRTTCVMYLLRLTCLGPPSGESKSTLGGQSCIMLSPFRSPLEHFILRSNGSYLPRLLVFRRSCHRSPFSCSRSICGVILCPRSCVVDFRGKVMRLKEYLFFPFIFCILKLECFEFKSSVHSLFFFGWYQQQNFFRDF